MFWCMTLLKEVLVFQVVLMLVSLCLFHFISLSLADGIFQTACDISHSTCSSFRVTLTSLPMKCGSMLPLCKPGGAL